MNILIPMAGSGSRFTEKGYTQHKPMIPLTDRHSGKQIPMVVAAVQDLPVGENTVKPLFIIRDFHETARVPEQIKQFYPQADFIVAKHLTEGQASTCLLAKDTINTDAPLLIAACDNGMDVGQNTFDTLSKDADAIIFTFRHNDTVTEKPQAYGWVKTQGADATGVSVKIPLSNTPMEDHAIVGTFWFRHGHDFVTAAEAMIAANDRINNEFYVDQVFEHLIKMGRRVKILEVSHYLCWGTPQDYESYEQTLTYWKNYLAEESSDA